MPGGGKKKTEKAKPIQFNDLHQWPLGRTSAGFPSPAPLTDSCILCGWIHLIRVRLERTHGAPGFELPFRRDWTLVVHTGWDHRGIRPRRTGGGRTLHGRKDAHLQSNNAAPQPLNRRHTHTPGRWLSGPHLGNARFIRSSAVSRPIHTEGPQCLLMREGPHRAAPPRSRDITSTQSHRARDKPRLQPDKHAPGHKPPRWNTSPTPRPQAPRGPRLVPLLPLYTNATPWSGSPPPPLTPHQRHLFLRLRLTFWSPISPLRCTGAARAANTAGSRPPCPRLSVLFARRSWYWCCRSATHLRTDTNHQRLWAVVRSAHAAEEDSGCWCFCDAAFGDCRRNSKGEDREDGISFCASNAGLCYSSPDTVTLQQGDWKVRLCVNEQKSIKNIFRRLVRTVCGITVNRL